MVQRLKRENNCIFSEPQRGKEKYYASRKISARIVRSIICRQKF